jgi:predicted P-loop ATPase
VEHETQRGAPALGGVGSDDGPLKQEQQPADMRLAAKSYGGRSWAPIRLKGKKPVARNWTQEVADENTHWTGNIGVRLGAPSAGLVDIDLDCDEARLLAPAVLPPTGAVFGRSSTPRAHWLYNCGETAPDAASTGSRFSGGAGDPNQAQKPLLELRSTGGQTMFPPSTHPGGEQLSWERYDDPGRIDAAQLTRAVEILAAASLLFRHFPGEGARFHAYAAMTGTMLRCDVSEEVVQQIVSVFSDRFGSPGRTRNQSVSALRRRLDGGDGKVPGFPRLAEVFGQEVARRCREWLESDDDWLRGKGGILAGALHNMQLAMRRLDVRLRYNEFADQMLVTVGEGAEQNLEDQVVNRLWFRVEEEFRFSPPQERFRTFLSDAACQNRFHPVRDYLSGLTWDGEKRIDTWLFDYGGIGRREDDGYNRYVKAVGRLILVAGARRIREPGCKFDEMLVLISEKQGTAKSTSLAILARRPEWFTDSVDLGMNDKEVIEQMRGKWIAEVPELRGSKRDVDRIKAFLSRQHDRARLAYGHFRTEVGRSFVLFGTANDARFLLDSTGNRRFWPIVGTNFDTEALERHADQLWAEAAAAEAAGESIRLPKELWAAAEAVQAESQVEDPWAELLRVAIGDWEGKIRADAVWSILGVESGRRSQYDNERMGAAMRQLGWKRTENSIRFSAGTSRGYTRGDATEEVMVDRDPIERGSITVRLGQPPHVEATRLFDNGVLRFVPEEKRF